VQHLSDAKARWPEYWCRPVPGWGDPRARILVVGLAPGLHGANRSGRMFTFDASGRWLYGTLHAVGLASRPVSTAPNDGLALRGVYITAAARCAPPQNRPTPAELDACRPFLAREIERLATVRVVVALGRIAHDAVLRTLGRRLAAHPFAHGAEHRLDRFLLLDSYHCSRQNTNTGRLTRRMFRRVFVRAARLGVID
jgi:uracil-DNA glycosylase family 4